MTAKIKKDKGDDNKLEYNDIARALGYWVILSDLSKFFKEANMPKVHKHLAAACKEIDVIWTEYETNNQK